MDARVKTNIPYGLFHSRLTWAAAGNHPDELVATLKDLPVEEVNWRDYQFGNTALHWAIANTNTCITFLLLETAGERIEFNTRDYDGKTVLHLAIGKGFEHFTGTPGRNTNDPPQGPVIQRLIDKMAEKKLLNTRDNLGNTPLHIAMIRRDYPTIEMLLKNGASLDIPNKKSETPRSLLTNIDFNFAQTFINKYVTVFTLTKETWDDSLPSLKTLLEQYPQPLSLPPEAASDLIAEEKHVLPSSAAKYPHPSSSFAKSRPRPVLVALGDEPDEKHDRPALIKINAPADIIFEQAISYLDSLTSSKTTDSMITQTMQKSARDFQYALRKLKKQSKHLSSAQRLKLAEESINLSMKTASLAVDENDIREFHQATLAYRKTSTCGKIIGAILGAVLGVFVGTMIGTISGPGAAVTALVAGAQGAILGAGIGGLVGSGLGFWASKKILERNHSLMQINRAASKIAQELKPK